LSQSNTRLLWFRRQPTTTGNPGEKPTRAPQKKNTDAPHAHEKGKKGAVGNLGNGRSDAAKKTYTPKNL